MQEELAKTSRNAIEQLSECRPGLLGEFYPEEASSVSFMRVVRYDSYPNEPDSLMLPVAKPHVDICGYTVQGWSSGPGFWGRTPKGKEYFDNQGYDGYFFASRTHEKIFSKESAINPLIHGVDRVTPGTETKFVPARTAVVLFVNPWRIDPKVTPIETKA